MAYDGVTNPVTSPAHRQTPLGPSVHMGSEAQHTDTGAATVSALSTNRRRSSLKMPAVLKRAVSSPNVGSLAMGEEMSLAEKKRNKLGYHRTAVACGHCRRRKIRCIPAYEDTTGRCRNCIRLKKDCHFFPIDQQGQSTGRRPRSSGKTEATNDADTSVSSSSPGILGSSSIEQIKDVNGQIDTPPLSQQGSFHSFARTNSVEQAEFPVHQEIEYPRPFEDRQHFGYPLQSPRGPERDQMDAQNSQYVLSHGQRAMRGSYSNSPYSPTPPSGSMTTSPHVGAFHFQQRSPSSDQFAWAPHPPSRSISIADTEDLHHNFAAYHRSNTYPSIDRRISVVQETMSTPHGAATMHVEGHQSIVTNAYHEPHVYQGIVHHGMGWSSEMPPPATRHPAAASEAYTQSWYSQPHVGLPNVQEEDHSHLYQPQPSHPHSFRPNPG